MGVLRRLYEGLKFMAVASDIPFIRNSADRKTAERFLRIKSYRQAFNLYRMTEQHAKNNNLIFDELVSLLRQRDILDDYSTDDKETAHIYGRLSEIEHLLDNSVDSWDKSITVAYNYTSSDSSGLNVPPVALSNVPGISESNVPPIAETNVPGVSL